MNKSSNQPDDDLIEAPPRLAKALRTLQAPPISVPTRVDETVLRLARQHLSRAEETKSRQRRPSWWIALANVMERFREQHRVVWRPWASAAALSAIVLSVLLVWTHFRPGEENAMLVAVEDVNKDGHVDILDAFVLARQVESGQIANHALDLNGDGVVDRSDADLIAVRAVSLDQRKHL
jgi:hypothetical protein